jgi:uncharacterized membrane protein
MKLRRVILSTKIFQPLSRWRSGFMGFKSVEDGGFDLEKFRVMPLFKGLGRRAMVWSIPLAIVTIGMILRFANLEPVVYWGDEVYSSMRIFGYTTVEIHRAIARNPLLSAEVLQSFQTLDPTNGLNASIKSMAIEDSHIAPLYFVLARIWASCFGDSAASLRSLSGVFGVLLMPATYYLAFELFNAGMDGRRGPPVGLRRSTDREPGDRRTAPRSARAPHAIASWAMVLVASSPLHLLMAREVRLYSLWTLMTVLSSIFLLRALKQPSGERWGLFAIVLTLNFYSNFLTIITFAGYLIYVLVTHRADRALIRQFGVASSVSLMGFAPWLGIFLTRQIVDNRDTEGVVGIMSGRLAIRNWFELLRRLVIDFNTTPATSIGWSIGLTAMTLLLIGLLILGFRRLIQERGLPVWLFILTLTLPLPLCFFDRSLQGLLPSRYLLPSYIGLQLVLAYWLGQQTIARSRAVWCSLIMVMIVLVGGLSCGQAIAADTWWNKHFSNCNPAIARMVNQSPNPLIISDGTGGKFFDHALSNILSLSRLVRPGTQFQLTTEIAAPMTIATGFSDRFVVTPSKILRDRLEQQHPGKLQPLLELENPYRGSPICLWRLLP